MQHFSGKSALDENKRSILGFSPPGPATCRAPDGDYACESHAKTYVLVPGRRPAQRRVRFVLPRLMVRLNLLRAPKALQSRCSTWARKYKIAPRGHNLPEIQAAVAALFIVEGNMRLRNQMRDILDQASQDYSLHSGGNKDPFMEGPSIFDDKGDPKSPKQYRVDRPVVQSSCAPLTWKPDPAMELGFDKKGRLLVLGVEKSGDSYLIHTHLGAYTFEHPYAEDWLEYWGMNIPSVGSHPGGLQPVMVSDMQVAQLRFLMELFTFAAELGVCDEPMWDLLPDGSLDLGLLPETQDPVTKELEDQQRSQNQVAMRTQEQSEAEEIGRMLAEDPDYVPAYCAGDQEEIPELAYDAVVVRKPSAKEQNTGQRFWVRAQLNKTLGLVTLEHTKNAYGSNWRKVKELKPLRSEKTWEDRQTGEDITRLCWRKDLFRSDWLINYVAPDGRQDKKVSSDIFRLLDGLARYGLECEGSLVSIVHRSDPTTYMRDGEERLSDRRYSKNRYFGALRNWTPKGGWYRWCPCAKENEDQARRAPNGKLETCHKREIHADVCRVCGREAAVVDAYVYLPIHWFSEVLQVENAPANTYIQVPIFGYIVKRLMTKSQLGITYGPRYEDAPLCTCLGEQIVGCEGRRWSYDGDIQWFEEPERINKISESWTQPARIKSSAKVLATSPRDAEFFVGPDRHLYALLDGGLWKHEASFPREHIKVQCPDVYVSPFEDTNFTTHFLALPSWELIDVGFDAGMRLAHEMRIAFRLGAMPVKGWTLAGLAADVSEDVSESESEG